KTAGGTTCNPTISSTGIGPGYCWHTRPAAYNSIIVHSTNHCHPATLSLPAINPPRIREFTESGVESAVTAKCYKVCSGLGPVVPFRIVRDFHEISAPRSHFPRLVCRLCLYAERQPGLRPAGEAASAGRAP